MVCVVVVLQPFRLEDAGGFCLRVVLELRGKPFLRGQPTLHQVLVHIRPLVGPQDFRACQHFLFVLPIKIHRVSIGMIASREIDHDVLPLFPERAVAELDDRLERLANPVGILAVVQHVVEQRIVGEHRADVEERAVHGTHRHHVAIEPLLERCVLRRTRYLVGCLQVIENNEVWSRRVEFHTAHLCASAFRRDERFRLRENLVAIPDVIVPHPSEVANDFVVELQLVSDVNNELLRNRASCRDDDDELLIAVARAPDWEREARNRRLRMTARCCNDVPRFLVAMTENNVFNLLDEPEVEWTPRGGKGFCEVIFTEPLEVRRANIAHALCFTIVLPQPAAEDLLHCICHGYLFPSM